MPYPTHEAWTPLLVAFVVVALSALTLPLIAERLAPGKRTLGGLALAVFALGCTVGFDALDPVLVNSPMPYAGIPLGLLGAGITLWRVRDATDEGSVWLGLILGAAPILLFAALEYAAVLPDPTEASQSSAEWRRRLAPWDADAALAMAWVAQRQEYPDIARSRLELAERLGADEAMASELKAELFAGEGDCASAREAFDRAMAVRAERALENFDLRLDDAYRLPETFVRECGLDGTAGPLAPEL